MSGLGDTPLATDGEQDHIEVLHVEDDPAFAEVAKRFLERCNSSLEVSTETDPERALDRLADGSFDCVLCDYDMPGMNGIELLNSLRESYPELPFILFTGKGSEEVASDAFSAGATDYFGKSSDASEYEVLAERIATVVDKYRTERQLERSEERYRRLVETAPVAIAVHRGDEIVFANRAAADFLGVESADELVGDDPLSYLETDDRAVARERVERLLADEATMESLEERYVDADGNLKYGLVAGSAVEYGGERAVQVVVRDVTDHREREQKLERYRQLVEAMGDGVYALDAEGCFEMFNERMTELTGYSREELMGLNAREVMTEEGLETVEDGIRSLLDGEADSVTLEVQGKRADGEVAPGELTLTLQPTGSGESFAGTIGVVRDVTERRERERELAAAEERFRTFFERSNDAAFIIDVAADEIRDANPAATELLGYTREELRGMAPATLHPDNFDRIAEFTQEVVEQGNGSLDDVTCYGRDGPVDCEMSAAVCEIDGRTCIINSVRDITERKQRERELEAKNERLEAFAEIVSHDLRNPLTVVDGHVELARELLEEGADSEDLRARLEAIAQTTDRMMEMTDDLLTLAKQGETAGERESVALAPLAREVWSTLETDGATLETEALGEVEADPTRLEQLLANLLENSVEHGSADDTVGASTDGGDGDDLTVVVEGTTDGFAVADDGSGIPADEQDDVFERGYSTDRSTGFGLAIVHTVAEAHGWTVTVGESEAGGARFEVHTDG